MVTRVLTDRDVPLNQLEKVVPLGLADYVGRGGYRALEIASNTPPADIIKQIERSGLRGRGGAGFLTAKKWTMVYPSKGKKYLCCNAAEDEPGTFKDRYLLRVNPHQIIEGVIIAAYAIGASEAYLYINGNYKEEVAFMEQALQASKEAGFWGVPSHGGKPTAMQVVLKICKSPGTYVAGEETALLEVIEGRVAAPRQKPPYYPARRGLFGMPTAVNNVETLANVPHILREGDAWFRGIGTESATGTMIFTVTGDVCRPGLYERPLGTSLHDLIYIDAGGATDRRRLKAVFPGGPSNTLLPVDQINVPLAFDALQAAGSALGTGAVIVMDDTVCMVRIAIQYARFFNRESCGQCPPCVLGTARLAEIMEKIEAGEGTEKDVLLVGELCTMVKGRGYCYLLTGAAIAVESIFRHFRAEYDAHIVGKCRAA